MYKKLITVIAILLLSGSAQAEEGAFSDTGKSAGNTSKDREIVWREAGRDIEMTVSPDPASPGLPAVFTCSGTGNWRRSIRRATITIRDAEGNTLVESENMVISGMEANYSYQIPSEGHFGIWSYDCNLSDRRHRETASSSFTVLAEDNGGDDPGGGGGDGIAEHQSIQSYEGPSTCISCHESSAREMLESLHMKWSGPTPELSNTQGEELGKAVGGINTFCTYAMSSKGACFSCHVRADGNAPHPPEENDVDCLMCHSDTYQRTFVQDPDNTETVTNVNGETKTYVFGLVDEQGNYTTVPDFSKMPAGTTMVDLARNVHLPTRKSCLRCHAKAGGGDWTKRGDMGLSSANPSIDEDVHLSPQGADLTCSSCHDAGNHKVGGRGIDLRQTEASDPTCQNCHSLSPHDNSTLNRHAGGQVSCQVCHIREFAKGGATEMARDWRYPVWNPAFCSGQGGFVGEETKASNVTPEYVWFDGTSSVYNIGETIEADERGIYPMARANGSAFDGISQIVPIKRHGSIMPLHESGQMVPPAIMWMFMTGDFDLAVRKGMEEQGMTGNYTLVDADAEMLISHGVGPKENAPSCTECHDGSGRTPDSTGMIPFAELGYHTWPDEVRNCTLCHESESMPWEALHSSHAADNISCTSCHTSDPVGLIKPESNLCNDCHEQKSWNGELHKKHIEKRLVCTSCHLF